MGGYTLQEVLGEGALGVVYRAVHQPTGEIVALKLLKPELGASDLHARRFAHEARAAVELRHRHLVPVRDAGVLEGRPFIAAEYVEGGSLAAVISGSGPLAVDKALRVAVDVASGLDALHRHRLVHRDVKPANIMVDSGGMAALTDFGLAKGAAYTALTRPGSVVGTPHYLAPELIEGSEASPASDIYALGCTLYECLVGTPPFAGRPLFEVAFGHLEEEPPNPSDLRPDLPPQLPGALLEALDKHARRRPLTATAYAHLLRFAADAVS
jgi:serine/threonine-protein kinase